MTKQCEALTKKGKRCPNSAAESGYCFTHDPAKAKERAEARKRGGRNKRVPKVASSRHVQIPICDISGVYAILDVATIDTLAQENSPQRTRGLVSIAMAYLKAIAEGEDKDRFMAIESALIRRDKNEYKN